MQALQSPPSRLNLAPQVRSPYTATSAPASGPQDRADINGSAPPVAPDPPAEASSNIKGLAGLALVGLAGMALWGALGPTIMGPTQIIAPPSIGITQTQPAQPGVRPAGPLVVQLRPEHTPITLPGSLAELQTRNDGQQQQDPLALIRQMVQLSEATNQAMQQVAGIQGGWNTTMNEAVTHYNEFWREADAYFRDPDVNTEQRWTNMQNQLRVVRADLARLRAQIEADRQAVDATLQQTTQLQNQMGTISFNLHGQLADAASQAPFLSPDRRALNDVSGDFRQASYDLAMAAERGSSSRATAQILIQNIDYVDKEILAKMDELLQKRDLGGGMLEQLVDGNKRIMGILQQGTTAISQETTRGAELAHTSSQHLARGLQKLTPPPPPTPGSGNQ